MGIDDYLDYIQGQEDNYWMQQMYKNGEPVTDEEDEDYDL